MHEDRTVKEISTIEMQQKLLEMMKWFHAFCVDNNLQYYALAGTMLGVARHEGFIPWDDDLDVGMPRRDYDKLYELLSYNPGDRYILETPESQARDYNYCFTKLYDTQTTLVENLKYKIRRGVYIDIFPLDGMGNTEIESKKHFSKIDRKFKLVLAHTTGIRKGRKLIKNVAVIISQTVLTPFIHDKKLIRRISELCREKNYEEYQYGGNSFGAYGFKEIMPRSVMGTPTLYKFEDMEIYGVEQVDEYLSRLYGNWRELPPKEKRVSHHDYIEIDLEKSYLAEDGREFI